MTERDGALEQFDALIGTWATEATHPELDAVARGTTTFEWLEGGRFLMQRIHNDHEAFPDSISVIGAPEAGDGLVMEYFDSRGVRRTYGISLEQGVLRIWRDDPTFAQRFSATLGHDAFEGVWQLARTPGDWHADVKMTYRRRREEVRLDHSVIAVSDWDVSNAFYRDVVGAELVPGGPGRVAYRLGDTQLNVHGPGVDVSDNVARLPVRPGNSDLCFLWPGPIAEAVAHLERHGIEVETGPVDRVGAGGDGASVYFRDPDGSLLEFISYAG
jgi:catechol 2,3-dioxygenase-like lactoylglutathione lyase family enzyme